MNLSKIFSISCLILSGFIISLCLPKCGGDPIQSEFKMVEKKGVILKQKRIADSLDKASDKTDSIRIIYVTKWRFLKAKLDSIPCPEALVQVIRLTDSIITVDSTEISELNAELFIKDLVIANQDSIIVNDSIAYRLLSNKLKRQKRKTKLALILAGIGWGVAAFK